MSEVKKTAADGQVVESSKFNVFALIVYRIIGTAIGYGFTFLLSSLLLIIPPVGSILLLITGISASFAFIENISFLFSNVKVTETGLVGRGLFFKSLNATFDQIESVSRERQKVLLVKVRNGNGKVKKVRLPMLATLMPSMMHTSASLRRLQEPT